VIMMESTFYLPAGSAGSEPYELEVTPESAGWGYSSLRVVALPPAGGHRFDTGPDEVVVLPLNGSVSVEVDGSHLDLDGRRDVFAGQTDVAYVGCGQIVTLQTEHGGRFALCGARTDEPLPLRNGPADRQSVELRGAGQASRLVRNFATPDALPARRLIACEVITPAGNWSSYPAHKHDETSDSESELEEIYYFEIARGPGGEPGFGFMRTSSSPGRQIELLEEVHDRDVVLVPYGWHGPCVAAPGFDMYYLNVMAGPSPERAWKITDHPEQAFVRASWSSEPVDPRLQKG
jgi:5-deoxy-glucuronate isomerase